MYLWLAKKLVRRLDYENQREGVRIAAKLATDASKDKKEEAKLVMDAAKQLQN